MADTPIQVDPNQIPAGAATLLRYALTTIGTVMVTRGLLPAGSDVNAIVGAALVIISTLYGLWKTYDNKQKLVTVATAAPNRVAVVK